MKYSISSAFFVLFMLFLIYAGFHPEKIAPDLFAEIIPLGALHILGYLSYVLPIIAFVFVAVNMAKYVKSGRAAEKNVNFWENFPIKSFTCFIGSLAVVLLLSDLAKTGARNEFKRWLDKVSSDVVVNVNGELVVNPNQVVGELKKVAPLQAHHSRTTTRISIEIVSGGDRLVVDLERDGDIAQEYWVFYPKYRWRLYDEIGRITTNLFDDPF